MCHFLKTLVATNASVAALGRTTLTHPGSKEWNSFYSPMFDEFDAVLKTTTPEGEFEMQLQTGSSLYPEYRIRSHAEAYYNLKKPEGLGQMWSIILI